MGAFVINWTYLLAWSPIALIVFGLYYFVFWAMPWSNCNSLKQNLWETAKFHRFVLGIALVIAIFGWSMATIMETPKEKAHIIEILK